MFFFRLGDIPPTKVSPLSLSQESMLKELQTRSSLYQRWKLQLTQRQIQPPSDSSSSSRTAASAPLVVPTCPNRSNTFHQCSAYCITMFGAAQQQRTSSHIPDTSQTDAEKRDTSFSTHEPDPSSSSSISADSEVMPITEWDRLRLPSEANTVFAVRLHRSHPDALFAVDWEHPHNSGFRSTLIALNPLNGSSDPVSIPALVT